MEGTPFGILRITHFLESDESEYGSEDYTDDETDDEDQVMTIVRCRSSQLKDVVISLSRNNNLILHSIQQMLQ